MSVSSGGNMIQSAPANLNKRRTTGYVINMMPFSVYYCALCNLFGFVFNKLQIFNYETLIEYHKFHEASNKIHTSRGDALYNCTKM